VPPREALWPWQRRSYDSRVATRHNEALAAAAALGLEPLAFASRPSRRLKAELGPALAEIRAAIAKAQPQRLWVSAWEGGHQDHDVANFLAAHVAGDIEVMEYAEYNYAGRVARSQRFPSDTGAETLLRLSPEEAAAKRALLTLYRSERGNLRHIGTDVECLRPLPRHDYAKAPHAGMLFRERFHWVPFPHPQIDREPTRAVHDALTRFPEAPKALVEG
jgi:LmbE family N-acetylglucosaminyl deacetylase